MSGHHRYTTDILWNLDSLDRLELARPVDGNRYQQRRCGDDNDDDEDDEEESVDDSGRVDPLVVDDALLMICAARPRRVTGGRRVATIFLRVIQTTGRRIRISDGRVRVDRERLWHHFRLAAVHAKHPADDAVNNRTQDSWDRFEPTLRVMREEHHHSAQHCDSRQIHQTIHV